MEIRELIKSGSSFNAGGRSRRMPSSPATFFGEGVEVLRQLRTQPGFWATPGGLVAPRPLSFSQTSFFCHKSGRLMELVCIWISHFRDAHWQAVGAEDHMHVRSDLWRPSSQTFLYAVYHRLDQTGRIMITFNVREFN